MKQGSFQGSSSRSAGSVGAALTVCALALVGCQDPNAGGARTKFDEPHHGAHGEEGPQPLPHIPPRPDSVSVAAVLSKAKQHFAPLPEAMDDPRRPATEEQIALGRMLYSDTRLSKNHDIACATCHDLAGFGVDIREQGGARAKTSMGHKGQMGDRNAPTVYNAALQVVQFWDGRARNVEEQAKGPVLNPVEMAMPDEAAVLVVLQSIPGYAEAFASAFPGQEQPITYDNMAQAIGAFERQLVTPAPFDRFLAGKLTALTEHQVRGLDLFIEKDCKQCHDGPAVGGGSLKKLGVVKPWEGLTDKGRAKETNRPEDEFFFKVPSLRNVAQTGPYLHDGSIASLDEMVQKMAQHQLGKGDLTEDELSAMVDFLGSLTGEPPAEYVGKPELPASGPDTPAPDPT
ncbi:cytochrome-c peroxidase [Paraliomyxa miuraensis]|uniref:cytochrome-c peroxidase n=1 Tax=Paraliomyxa miuraensis TaxID=376150 RepID=UPI0022589F71|nr:cytochrome c peroxidase [Paraliomyxa miuraensis]MCX4247217.1 c-type cytochrome [Paraliomyxa miuraensis]